MLQFYRNTAYDVQIAKICGKFPTACTIVSKFEKLKLKFSYSVNFVPDLSNFLESENNLVHIMKIFLALNLMKISF